MLKTLFMLVLNLSVHCRRNKTKIIKYMHTWFLSSRSFMILGSYQTAALHVFSNTTLNSATIPKALIIRQRK
ncbi:hypothetical protein METBIDRAFT_31043 [Metschnikowia bicuspidata var. bicuspidata NRRL YB-4993]|uniref:Uncharacterized protein n=1 Tax=Metschnikowia bicuspidata var. bicuspidata NRRL YB-4993 TaxID=869754 RepID=A0A1A0HDT2_9ASCO|nr:hypothetical protein METBIDRAFT_31043 [Metschnikowia bicuspidata var. bicuspidata NRRL YB-4993]OBA22083.1 hypothetical protein METBIDRAFT_31043 [Metschnikowia bicuspidata var. bicuspidata NRRL YB-4993]